MTSFMQREQAETDTPNPYNKNKEWDGENANGQTFVSADDSLGVVQKPKYAMINDGTPPPAEEANEVAAPEANEAPAEEAPKKYKRTNWNKRYNDLKKHHDSKINQMKAELAAAKADARPSYTPPKTAEDLEAWKVENPDLYAVVETIAHMRTSSETETMQEQVKQLNEKVAYENARAAYAELKALVPDFEEIRRDPAFHDWAEAQPAELQNWIYNNSTDASLAAHAINLYKASRGVTPAEQPKPPVSRPDASEAVAPKRHREEINPEEKVWTAREIDSMSVEEYESNITEIQKALKEGRIQP